MIPAGNYIALFLYTSAVFYTNYIGQVNFPPPNEPLNSNESYDFIIIGGGTAGSLLAARLSEDENIKVLLIDRGGSGNDYTDIPFFANGLVGIPNGYSGPPLFKSYNTTAQKYVCQKSRGVCSIKQGNSLGGGGNSNSNYVRGSPMDYDTWDQLLGGSSGWSYSEVLPYFKRSEKCINESLVSNGNHGNYGEQVVSNTIVFPTIAHALEDAAKEQGFIVNSDYNDPRYTNSFDYVQSYVGYGQVYTSRRSFLETALERKNLKVVCFAQARKIIFNGNQATGVEYNANGMIYVVNVTKEVIVSAGAIDSPKLLMLSGIGDKETLGRFDIPVVKDLPTVGKGLQDRARLGIKFSFPENPFDFNYADLKEYKNQKTGNLAKNPAIYVGFMNIAPFSINTNDTRMQLIVSISPSGFNPGLSMSVNNLAPKSRGYVTLLSDDPNDDPIVDPNYLATSEDREIFRAGVKLLAKYANSTALKHLNLTLRTPESGCEWGPITLESFTRDVFIDCYLKDQNPSLFHVSSTCAMGSVVDSQLKVIGIENLRVVDGSIMPNLVRGNPNAAVTMIAEKGAAMIKKNYAD